MSDGFVEGVHLLEQFGLLGAASPSEERPELELAVPVGLSICCFRYVPPNLPDGPGREDYLNLLNERLMTDIQLDGRAFCSNAVLSGRFVLRDNGETPDTQDALFEYPGFTAIFSYREASAGHRGTRHCWG